MQPDKPEDVRVQVRISAEPSLQLSLPGLASQASTALCAGNHWCPECPQAWYMDSSDADQRLPHQLSPNQPAPLEALGELGLLAYRLDADVDPDTDPRLQAIRKVRGYTYGVSAPAQRAAPAEAGLPLGAAAGSAGCGTHSLRVLHWPAKPRSKRRGRNSAAGLASPLRARRRT